MSFFIRFFMAHRATFIIAFHGVESIYILYIYIYVCATCTSMHCIRSYRSCINSRGLGQLMGVTHKRTHVWTTDQPGSFRRDLKLLITVVYSKKNSINITQKSLTSKYDW